MPVLANLGTQSITWKKSYFLLRNNNWTPKKHASSHFVRAHAIEKFHNLGVRWPHACHFSYDQACNLYQNVSSRYCKYATTYVRVNLSDEENEILLYLHKFRWHSYNLNTNIYIYEVVGIWLLYSLINISSFLECCFVLEWWTDCGRARDLQSCWKHVHQIVLTTCNNIRIQGGCPQSHRSFKKCSTKKTKNFYIR